MNYDPVALVKNILNKVEDLLEYGDMENCPYYQPQVIVKAYNTINKTRNSYNLSSPGIDFL